MAEANNTTNRTPLVITAIVCLVVGAAAGAWYMQRGRQAADAMQTPSSPGPAAMAAPTPNQAQGTETIVVSIPSDALQRMGLGFAPAATAADRTDIRVPGTIEPNGYRQVPVTPVAGGIVREVTAELGATVQRGEKMARIFSQELADAQAELIGMDADFEVAHRKMLRTQELVKLGAASQQELEEVEAEHQSHSAHIEQARQKLLLLGLTPLQVDQVRRGSQVSSEFSVPAPIDGAVLSRSVNLGQVVATGQELFKVTDLTSVWIEGNLLEDDFASVRIGSQATITTTAYPNRAYRGTVDYIDPRVDPQTRTAKVRLIVNNGDGALRLGMYADLVFATSNGRSVIVIPASAIQQIGAASVVYVPVEGTDNQFEQRIVTSGEETERGRQILSGLRAGEHVVTDGSFLLRAESLRQHPQ